MSIHAANLVIGNTVIDLSNTTVEQVIYDRGKPVVPETMPVPEVDKYAVHLEHLKLASSGPHSKTYLADMVTPILHFKKGYKLIGTEKTHRKSSYVAEFLQEDK